MDLSWILEPATFVGFVTLVILEIVLGIDNLVFVAILANKAHPRHRDQARILGLSLAVVIRIVMLYFMSYIQTLTEPKPWLMDRSTKDLVMLLGGLFLLFKATTELHERLEGNVAFAAAEYNGSKAWEPVWVIVVQILVIDAVFSLDTVITAVHVVEHITIAMVAVVVAMAVMIWASKPLTSFVDKHPTIVILCLGFLLLIGFSLVAEGFGLNIPKAYLYVAIGFSILIEVFNQVALRNRRKHAMADSSWRKRTADAVLSMMGMRENVIADATRHGHPFDDNTFYAQNEKNMIRSVLTIGERSVPAIMTPRQEIERLDVTESQEDQIKQIQSTPFSRLIAVGKAGIDDPLGYVAKKDLLDQLLKDGKLDPKAALREPLIIPETATVLNALEQFRASSADCALVVDEFGTIDGLLTTKDILESIAGDFPEEYEKLDDPSLKVNPDGSIEAEGTVEFDAIAALLRLPPIKEAGEFHTLSGFLMEMMEVIPNEGDVYEFNGSKFEVVKRVGQRIAKVKLPPPPQEFDAQ